MSPIQMGSLRVNNSVTNISRLGTFKYCFQEPRFEEETERPKTAPLIQEKSLVSFIQVSY